MFDIARAQEILARGDPSAALVTGVNLALLAASWTLRAWPRGVLA